MIIFFILFSFLKSEEINPCLKTDSTNPDKCISCLKGYGLTENGECQICPAGTYSYGGTMKCASCSEYANCKNDETKETCRFYSRYEGSAQCSYCSIKGFVNHFYTGCYSCSRNCEECESGKNAGRCNRCKEGYGLNPNTHTCVKCNDDEFSDGFTECRKSTSTIEGYLFFDTSEGIYKSNNENYCKTFNEDGTCASCLNGEEPSDGVCTNAFDIITNGDLFSDGRCSKMSTSTSGTSKTYECLSCNKPYVLENGVCILCLNTEHYVEKTDENGNNVGQCVRNNFGCVHQVGETCYGCDEGFLLVDNVCKLIDEKCEIVGGKNCEKCENDALSIEDGKCDNLIANCDYSKDGECLMCSNTYEYKTDNGNTCVENTICKASSGNYCFKTINGKTTSISDTTGCNNNQDLCITPSGEDDEGSLTQIDYQCKENFYLTKDSKTCINANGCAKTENSRCIKCDDGYYLYQGGCVSLTQIIPGCKNATYDYTNENLPQYENIGDRKVYCIECESGKQLYNGYCYDASKLKGTLKCGNDLQINSGELISCNCGDGKLLNIDGCYDLSQNCKTGINSQHCQECMSNYFSSEGICYQCENGKTIDGLCYQRKETQQQSSLKGNDNDNCYLYSSKGCLKCNSGYYVTNEGKCEECGENCLKCNSEQCLECSKGLALNNGECKAYEGEGCETPFPDNSGCAICKTTHYRDGELCKECDESCSSCSSSNECKECATDYFKDSVSSNETKLCHHYDKLTNCVTKTQTGCEKCEDGYYLDVTRCTKCHENCTACSSETVCSACADGFVFKNSNKESCMKVEDLKHCKSAKDGLCESCEGDYVLSSDKLSCDDPPPNYGILIGLPVGVGGAVLLLIAIIIIILIFVIKSKREKHERMKNITMFDIDKTNIEMKPLQNDILSNKTTIDFNEEVEEIEVNEQSRETICIGNNSKRKMTVQFTLKEGCEKYEMETNPKTIDLSKNKACEFEIFITPLCSCKIDEQIILSVLYLDDSSEEHIPIKIYAKTKLTTRLDYDELKQEKKLGEGSFGIVYLGEFRGNKVAIKRMKAVGDESDQNKSMQEFEKEVDMLDKKRNDYIIHFYGAVFIPNKICMVTEFAPYGSLQDLINKRKNDLVDEKLRVKFMLDASKGINYLHTNGILHRDIKPDNFLVLSLEDNIKVNVKLTDFGSSRNLNLMMTNMTFTKGVGSPAYMAPEILNRERYNRSSDVYSFAITMLECFTWGEAFPKTIYKFPWDVADLISSGRRPELINEIHNDEMKLVIQGAWKHEPKDRLTIDQIVPLLETILGKME